MQIICFKFHIASMASTSKLVKEETVLDILNEPDGCVISDINDDGDDSGNY
jgi:hypothetical protein